MDLLTFNDLTSNDRGYRIDGAVPEDDTGFSVAGAGDINRDGRPDVFVGTYSADPDVRLNAGAAYVVYGKADTEPINLATFEVTNENGFRLDGEAAGDRAGRSVGRAGDFNGDGQLDVLLGADMANNEFGAAYIYLVEPPPNNPPEAKENSYMIKQGRTLEVDAKKGVLKNDSDPDGDRLRVERMTDEPDHGRLKIDPDGSFVYKPEKNFRGKDSFEYEVSDGEGGADRAEVTIKVKKDKNRR